jgi:NAD(P)-dependent dehydrogenase (short-subunit alcohol dehydrogenase family)
MPTVMITGANRGLGLEFTRQYLEQGWRVIACTRQPGAEVLRSLDCDRLSIRELDVTDHTAVDELAEALRDEPIDVLINNAGTSGPQGFPECSAYSGLDNTDYEIWRRILEINLLGAFKVATAFYDHVAKSERRVLINMSSDLGSVTQNTQGDLYNYRSSKAGLNIVTKGFGNEWPDIISIAMAPGWCQTELGGTGAEIDPVDSVRDQIKTINALTREHSGTFINRFGESVPW